MATISTNIAAAPTRRGAGGELIVAVARDASATTLYDVADYRQRYALYKSDPDLQRAHAAHAFFHSFDDHEIGRQLGAGHRLAARSPPEIFRIRRAAALQAWYEHMPVRRASMPRYGEVAMHRGARYGDLVEIDILDTRQFRSNQPCEDGFKPVCAEVRAQAATVLGAEQEAWLARNLAAAAARAGTASPSRS